MKKQILVEILKNKDFRCDNNLKEEEFITCLNNYLDENGLHSFIDTDSKDFEIKVCFIQGKQYQYVILKETVKEKFVIEITKDELLKLIK